MTRGHELVNHSDKAELIWQSFKERLGTTNFTGLRFDLSSFFNHTIDLSPLIEPFRKEEVDAVVRALPSDKTPGPDGFNTDFVKKVLVNYL